MRIPPYWKKGHYTSLDAQGKEKSFVAWGWSFTSLAEAEKEAVSRASRIFQHFETGTRLERYAYFENPMREEIIQTIQHQQNDIAIITRNRYGALILNSASVLFADIDFPEQKSNGGFIGKLFGKKKPVVDVQTETLQQVKDWSAINTNTPFRIYRTYAGLRLLFTGKLYQAGSSETDELLASLGCDPLYRHLTRKQESFRARLTPKPWRCNCPKPPNQYPWEDASAEQTYRQWEQRYTQKTQGYATCELIEIVGADTTIDEIETVIQHHDVAVLKSQSRLA